MTSGPQIEMTRLVETPDLVITRGTVPGMAGVPIVVFAAAAPDVRTAQTLEFTGFLAEMGRPVYWISDPRQTWYATPGLVDRVCEVLQAEMARLGADQIDTLGNSMGGFGALAFAEKLPVRTAIAFGPRYSPDNRIVPDPRLKRVLRPYLDQFPFPTIASGMAAAGHAIVVHGDQGPDQPHILMINPPDNAEHWVVSNSGHLVAKVMRDRRTFAPFLRAALRQDWDAMHKALRTANALPAAELHADVAQNYAQRLVDEAKLMSKIKTTVRTAARGAKALFRRMRQPVLSQ